MKAGIQAAKWLINELWTRIPGFQFHRWLLISCEILDYLDYMSLSFLI